MSALNSSTATAFDILGIAPTDEFRLIKRAYFRALQTSGPEKNPDQFRRIRLAYETLSNAATRSRILVRLDCDRGPSYADLEARWGQKLQQAADERDRSRSLRARTSTLVAHLAESTFEDAVELFSQLPHSSSP